MRHDVYLYQVLKQKNVDLPTRWTSPHQPRCVQIKPLFPVDHTRLFFVPISIPYFHSLRLAQATPAASVTAVRRAVDTTHSATHVHAHPHRAAYRLPSPFEVRPELFQASLNYNDACQGICACCRTEIPPDSDIQTHKLDVGMFARARVYRHSHGQVASIYRPRADPESYTQVYTICGRLFGLQCSG